jgi:transposase-like protein
MARKRHDPEEVIKHLRTFEIELGKGTPLETICRKIGISDVTYHRWKREYGGLRVEQARRLKELEIENARLKKIVADLSVDNSILKEVSKGNF